MVSQASKLKWKTGFGKLLRAASLELSIDLLGSAILLVSRSPMIPAGRFTNLVLVWLATAALTPFYSGGVKLKDPRKTTEDFRKVEPESPACRITLPLLTFVPGALVAVAIGPVTVVSSVAGAVLLLVGALMHHGAVQDLGRYWINGRVVCNDHKIVSTGWYSIVRHPVYAADFLFGAGLLLMMSPAAALWGLLLVPVMRACDCYRAPHEERLMLKEAPAAYALVMQLPRYIPRREDMGRALRLLFVRPKAPAGEASPS